MTFNSNPQSLVKNRADVDLYKRFLISFLATAKIFTQENLAVINMPTEIFIIIQLLIFSTSKRIRNDLLPCLLFTGKSSVGKSKILENLFSRISIHATLTTSNIGVYSKKNPLFYRCLFLSEIDIYTVCI